MKIKQILAFIAVVGTSTFLLNSCGDEALNPAPSIDMIAENGSIVDDVSMDGDKTFTIVFNVKDDSKVKTVTITSAVDGRISPQLDTTVNSANAKIKITRKSLARIATEAWTLTATDDKGSSTSKLITITTTTTASGDILTSYELDNSTPKAPFKVWNIHGPNAGAFDLIEGSSKLVADNNYEKDICDSCTLVERPNWPGRWTSKNGTTFKKVNGSYTYADLVNTGQLDAAWNASGTAIKFMTLTKGDLYIANIPASVSPARAGGKVLIEITDVKKTTASTDNLDYIQFKFKRK
jgi:hypothetical protein